MEGRKDDDGKVRMDLLCPVALEELAKVLTFGAKKYEPWNWAKGMAWSRVYGALLRHLNAFWQGHDTDEETGLHHLAHAFCCLMFLVTYQKKGTGKDDRVSYPSMKEDTRCQCVAVRLDGGGHEHGYVFCQLNANHVGPHKWP
jgi:hypothetical protein